MLELKIIMAVIALILYWNETLHLIRLNSATSILGAVFIANTVGGGRIYGAPGACAPPPQKKKLQHADCAPPNLFTLKCAICRE